MGIIGGFIKKELYHAALSMVQSAQAFRGEHLENYADDILSRIPSNKEGVYKMAHKYQQRVNVVENGRETVKWATGNTQEEFQRSLFNILTAYNKYGEHSPQIVKNKFSDISWADYALDWFEAYKKPYYKSEKTATTRESYMRRHVATAFSNMAIDEITTKDVVKAISSKRDLSKATMRDIMSLMREVFRSAKKDGLIEDNPMDDDRVKNPCTKEIRRKALDESEQADIIQHISDIQKPMDRLFMAFLMFTPMRPGEIFALKWEDIDFELDEIHVMRGSSFNKGRILMGEDGETKTGWSGVRTIPMMKDLKKYLLPFKKKRGFVFSRDSRGHEGEPFSEQTARRQWDRIKAQIDIHNMVPYEGRHTFATRLAYSGVEQATTIKMLGHKDERMSNRVYVHANAQHVKAAGARMEDFYRKLENDEADHEANAVKW